MSLELQVDIALRMLLAALLSMVIGIDRERRQRAAGIRTHMLVGVGACVFSALSLYAFPGNTTSSIAANVVTGVGFMGAGTILNRTKKGAAGLTTAAGIWVTAAVGMAVGAGAWFLAICTTLVIWFILAVVYRVEIHGFHDNPEDQREN